MLQQTVEQLTETLKGHVLARFGHVVERVVLQPPPRLAMGDLATPLAIELAKALKKPPRQIAESLAEGLQLPSTVRSVSVEGAGYLNFRFDRGMFTSAYFRDVAAPPAPAGERVIVEHTNINPNKAAHIGHLRNAVLGDGTAESVVVTSRTVRSYVNQIDQFVGKSYADRATIEQNVIYRMDLLVQKDPVLRRDLINSIVHKSNENAF